MCVVSGVYMWTDVVLHEEWAKAVVFGFRQKSGQFSAPAITPGVHITAARACAAS